MKSPELRAWLRATVSLSTLSALGLLGVAATDAMDGVERPALGKKAIGSSIETPEADIGTALSATVLDCYGSQSYILDTISDDKEVQISVHAEGSNTGFFSIGFRKDDANVEYIADFPGDEDLAATKQELVGHKEGIVQRVSIDSKTDAVFRLFAAVDNSNPTGTSVFVEAKCMPATEPEVPGLETSQPLSARVVTSSVD